EVARAVVLVLQHTRPGVGSPMFRLIPFGVEAQFAFVFGDLQAGPGKLAPAAGKLFAREIIAPALGAGESHLPAISGRPAHPKSAFAYARVVEMVVVISSLSCGLGLHPPKRGDRPAQRRSDNHS